LQQGKEKVHGAALGAADVAQVKTKFGFDPEQFFYVPPEVHDFYSKCGAQGAEIQAAWKKMYEAYSHAYPKEAQELARRENHQLPSDIISKLPAYAADAKAMATRQHGAETINALAPILTELVGGSADLNPSTLTYLKCSADFQDATPAGRNIRFGVREHGIVAFSYF